MIAKISSKLKIKIPPAHGISGRILAPEVGIAGRGALLDAGNSHDFYTRVVGTPYIVGYDVINRDLAFDSGTFDNTQLLADGRIQLTPTGITNGVGYYTTPIMDLGDQYFMESIGLDQIIDRLAQISKIEVRTSSLPGTDLVWTEGVVIEQLPIIQNVSNGDVSFGNDSVLNEKFGNEFKWTGEDYRTASISVWLRKTGSPTDAVRMKIYNSSEVLVATSTNDIDNSSIIGSLQKLTFNFDISNFPLVDGDTYFFAAERTGTWDAANYYRMDSQNTNVYTDGQWIKYHNGAWITTASRDAKFEIEIETSQPIVWWEDYPTGLNNQSKKYIQVKLTFSSDVSNTYTPILRTINIYRDITDNDDIFILGSEFPFASGLFSNTALNKFRHVELDVDGGDYFVSGYWLSPTIDLGEGRYFKSLKWESREPEGTEIDSTPGAPKTIELRASATGPIDLLSNPRWIDFTDWALTGLVEHLSVNEFVNISTLSVGDSPLMISKNASIIDNVDNPGENVIECKGAYSETKVFDYENKSYETFAPTRILEEFEPVVDGEIQFDAKFVETDDGVVISAMEYLTDAWKKKFAHMLVKDGKIYDLPLAMFSEKIELGNIPYDEWLSIRIASDVLNNTCKLYIDSTMQICDDVGEWVGVDGVITLSNYVVTRGSNTIALEKSQITVASTGVYADISPHDITSSTVKFNLWLKDKTVLKSTSAAARVFFISNVGGSSWFYRDYTLAELSDGMNILGGDVPTDFVQNNSPDASNIIRVQVILYTDNITDLIPADSVYFDYWREEIAVHDITPREIVAGINTLELRAFPSTYGNISESFSGVSLDSGKWKYTPVVADDQLNQTYVNSGLFTDFTTKPVNSIINKDRWGIESLFELTGDFIIEVDWEWIKAGWGDIFIPTGAAFFIELFSSDDKEYNLYNYISSVGLIFQGLDGTETHGDNLTYRGLKLLKRENGELINRAGTIGEPVLLQQLANKFRLKRDNDLITFEYWNGADWIIDGKEIINDYLPMRFRVSSDVLDDTDLPWSIKVNGIDVTGPNTNNLTDTEFLIKNIQSIYTPADTTLQLDNVDSGEAILTYDAKDNRDISNIAADMGNDILNKITSRDRNLNHGRFKSLNGEDVIRDIFDDSSLHAGWTEYNRNNAAVTEGASGVILYTPTDNDAVSRLVQNIENLSLSKDVECETIYERPIWPIATLPSSLLFDVVVDGSTKYIITFTNSNTNPSAGFIAELTTAVALSGITDTDVYIGYNGGSPPNVDVDGYGELIDQNDKGVPVTTGNGIWFYQDTDNSFKLVINNTGVDPWYASGEIYIPGQITISSITKNAVSHTPTGKSEVIKIHNWFNSIRLLVEAGNRGVVAAISRITNNTGSKFLVEFTGADSQSDFGVNIPYHLDDLFARTRFLSSDLPIYSTSNVPPDRTGISAGPIETLEENNQEGTTTYRKFTTNVSLVAQEKIRIRYQNKIQMEADEFNDALSRNWLIFEYQTDSDWIEITRIETSTLDITNFFVECSNTKTRESLQTSIKDMKVICTGNILASLAKFNTLRKLSEFSVIKITGPGSAILLLSGTTTYTGYQKGNYIITVESGPVLRIQEPNGNEYTNVSISGQSYHIPGNINFSFDNHLNVAVGDQWAINVMPSGHSYKFNTRKARYIRHYLWGTTHSTGDFESLQWMHIGVFNEGTQDLALFRPVRSNYRWRVTRPAVPPYTIDPNTMIIVEDTAWVGARSTIGTPPSPTWVSNGILYSSEVFHITSSNVIPHSSIALRIDMRNNRLVDAISFADGAERTIDKISNNTYGDYERDDGDQYDRVNIWGYPDGGPWEKIAQYDHYKRFAGRRMLHFNPGMYRYIQVEGTGNTGNYLKYTNRNDTFYGYMHMHSIANHGRNILTNNYIHWSHAWSGYADIRDYVTDRILRPGEPDWPYAEVDLGSVQDINEINIALYDREDRSYYNQKIEISEDGAHWETIWIGFNPTGGGYIDDNGDVIEIKKREFGINAIRSELLPPTGWLTQLEIDDVEPQYSKELDILRLVNTESVSIADIDEPIFNDNEFLDDRGYHSESYDNINIAGIKLFNKYRFDYARFGGFFEIIDNNGVRKVWNHRTKQWVVFNELDRSPAQLYNGDATLQAGPANPDWPPVSFLWSRNTKYIFEIERTYLQEDTIPILRNLELFWFNMIDKSYKSNNDRFDTVISSRDQGIQASAIINQKFHGTRYGTGVNPTPKSGSLYNNVIEKVSLYKKIGGVLKSLNDEENLTSLKVYNGDFVVNDNAYKVIYADAFFSEPRNLTSYPYIDFWYDGALRTTSASPPFSDRFYWQEWNAIYQPRGDSSGGGGAVWSGIPIDVSKGAVFQWNAFVEEPDDSTIFGLTDTQNPLDIWSSKLCGIRFSSNNTTAFDIYYNGTWIKNVRSTQNYYNNQHTKFRIEILPNQQGTRFWYNTEGHASTGDYAFIKHFTDSIYLNGRTGTMLPRKEERWELIYETDVPIIGADTKYFGWRKLPEQHDNNIITFDDLIIAEYAADEKPLTFAVGNDYDVTPMNISLGDTYPSGYDINYWAATLGSDVVFEDDGTDGLKMRLQGNGSPVVGIRDSNVHTRGGLFYLNVDADFDVKTTIDLASFPVQGDHGGGESSYASLELESYSDGPETVIENAVQMRYQVSDISDRVYLRYRTNDHWSIWMALDISPSSTVGLRIKRSGATMQCLYRVDNGRWEIFNSWIYAINPGTSNKWAINLASSFATQWITDRSVTFKELNVEGINYATAGTVLGYGTFEYAFDQVELDQQLTFRIKDENGTIIESASVDVKDTNIINTTSMAKDLVFVGDKVYGEFAGKISIRNFKTIPFKYGDTNILTRFNIEPNPDPNEDAHWSPWYSDGNSRLVDKSDISYNTRYIQVKVLFNRTNPRYNPRLTNIGFDMDLAWHKDSEPFDEDPIWGVGGSLPWLEIEQDQDISDIGGEHSRFVQVKTTLKS